LNHARFFRPFEIAEIEFEVLETVVFAEFAIIASSAIIATSRTKPSMIFSAEILSNTPSAMIVFRFNYYKMFLPFCGRVPAYVFPIVFYLFKAIILCMPNIFERKGREAQVFRSESVLYPEHVPVVLPHRDAEIDALVFALKPVSEGKKSQHVFVFGKTGTGKTASVKFVLNELEEFSDRAKGLYLNCFEFNSRHSILSAIANFLKAAVPRRGIATDEVYSKILEMLKKSDFAPIVVLDEAEQLLAEPDEAKVFYDLLRVIEFCDKRFGLIMISNDPALVSRLDERVRSSLHVQDVPFNPYSPQQLKDILRERCKYAFLPGALEEEVLNVAAGHASRLGGDARIAIECVWRAGKEAEKENSQKVSLEHLKKAFALVDEHPFKKVLPSLNDSEVLVLRLLCEHDAMLSGGLFKKFLDRSGQKLSLRRFRDIVSKLESLKLVNAPLIEKGMHGKSRLVSLAVSSALLSEEMKKAQAAQGTAAKK